MKLVRLSAFWIDWYRVRGVDEEGTKDPSSRRYRDAWDEEDDEDE